MTLPLDAPCFKGSFINLWGKVSLSRVNPSRTLKALVPLGQFAFPFSGKPVHFIGNRDAKDLLKGVAAVVIRASVGCGIVESVRLGSPNIIAGQFKTLDMHGIFL